ncbi:NAD(P)H-hydrate dehydratase [Bacillus sp. Marseille-P3800]|uniref:NAD(P)H-hydrate dehydratase n=1 Tax=Bacillus sp. Marseille-P3800 TaxID=2014782 RepID=UPI000C087A67|nr:NAD(P)H-hydrate dehydratase [Bacillus sp. Marseille-P3800]
MKYLFCLFEVAASGNIHEYDDRIKRVSAMRIVTGEEMASVEAITMNKIGLPGVVLMENAGREIARKLIEQYGHKRYLILIGAGNNGGDGFVVARMLREQGIQVITCIVAEEHQYTGDAKLHKRIYEQSGYRWKYWHDLEPDWMEILCHIDVIVDAMLGTGVRGALKDPYPEIIEKVNQSQRAVVAIDLPSGVPADESEFDYEPIQADQTYCLQLMKLSYFLEATKPFYGKTDVLPIGVPPATFKHLEKQRCIWGEEEVFNSWLKPSSFAHKGKNGRVGIIAGHQDMPGAASLVTSAAVQSGAGLTTVAAVTSVKSLVSSHVKEAMFATFTEREGHLEPTEEELLQFYENKDVLTIGPGIGRGDSIKKIVAHAIEYFEGTLLLDADALHCINECLSLIRERSAPLIITPHPGEMSMLTNVDTGQIKKRRFEIAEAFARENGIYVVLKGPHTIVAMPNGFITVNMSGNEGLAKGGTGDVLTGIITALAARQTTQVALSTSVYLHGYAADLFKKDSWSADNITPSYLIEKLPEAFKVFTTK